MLALRLERTKRDWSLTQVCVKTGIDPGALSKIERGLWPCGPSWRRKLSDAFGLPEERLFSEVVCHE